MFFSLVSGLTLSTHDITNACTWMVSVNAFSTHSLYLFYLLNSSHNCMMMMMMMMIDFLHRSFATHLTQYLRQNAVC